MSQTEKVLREALEVLEAYASSQICTHDDTHRGGTLWEICDQCGAKWADDKGGKPRFKWPKEILAARAALYPPETQGEPVAGDSRVCHAPGDKCYGCPHYHGKASVCSYAPPSQPSHLHGGMMYDDYAMKQINRLAFENGQFRHLLGEAVSMMSKFDQHLTMRQHEAWGMDQVGDLIERINGAVNAEWAP